MKHAIKVLIIDDDPSFRDYLGLMIKLGYSGEVSVTTVETLIEAVDFINADTFDICFLDYLLEDYTGVDILRRTNKVRNRTSIIMMTGISKDDIMSRCIELGVDDFVLKSKLDQFEINKMVEFADHRLKKRHFLESSALRDALTGVGNRHLFMEQLSDCISNTRRHRSTAAIVMMDLDGFKPINDAYGHQMGDEVLVEFTSRVEQSIRANDILARLGGDEFALILGGIDNQVECLNVLVKIRNTVEKTPFHYQQETIQIGVSMGIAQIPDDGDDVSQLLELADARMYEDKKKRKSLPATSMTIG